MLYRMLLSMLLLSFGVSAVGAETARLKLPDFRHLQGKAIESIDVTVGPTLLGLARKFGADDPDAQKVLGGLESISVLSYQFQADNVYSPSDIDGVRKQLENNLWKRLAQIRSRDQDNVDIFVALENDQPIGFAILAADAREFTIVNIVGKIDFEDLGKLQGTLGLPDGAMRTATND